jgi:hypothetical protein
MVEKNGERSYSANTVQGVINSFFVHRGCLASAVHRLNLHGRPPHRSRARRRQGGSGGRWFSVTCGHPLRREIMGYMKLERDRR